jgi:hypothetical protein
MAKGKIGIAPDTSSTIRPGVTNAPTSGAAARLPPKAGPTAGTAARVPPKSDSGDRIGETSSPENSGPQLPPNPQVSVGPPVVHRPVVEPPPPGPPANPRPLVA